MPTIKLHDVEIDSVFQLLGRKENDLTYALGWTLFRSPKLLSLVAERIFGGQIDPSECIVSLQQGKGGRGITDIELKWPNEHAIIEAKVGWNLPTIPQLKKYSPRIERPRNGALVTVSGCSSEYAKYALPSDIEGIKTAHISWSEFYRFALRGGKGRAERLYLKELTTYLEEVVEVDKETSNQVYVVSLNRNTPANSPISYVAIVNQLGRYYHPVGNTWPKSPPNYIGFRYDGKLQSIHHVEKSIVTTDLSDHLDGFASVMWQPHFLHTLGPSIGPPSPLPLGSNVTRSRHLWSTLDLLLTSKNLTEAEIASKKRVSKSATN